MDRYALRYRHYALISSIGIHIALLCSFFSIQGQSSKEYEEIVPVTLEWDSLLSAIGSPSRAPSDSATPPAGITLLQPSTAEKGKAVVALPAAAKAPPSKAATPPSQTMLSSRASYEDALSLWLAQHRPAIMPSVSHHSHVVLDITIAPNGEIIRYSLEEDAPDETINQAILAMVARANPAPPLPPSLHHESALRFRVPIEF